MIKIMWSLIIFLFLLNSHIFSQNYVVDFALYDPSYEDDGVWEEEVTALKAMFFTYNWSFKTIDHNDINNGELGNGNSRRYNAIIFPGGWALNREIAITPTGEENIRSFVSSGGNYVGFCAGVFWASDITDWAQTATGENGTYNQESDYTAYDYNLNLLNGSAKGPFGWTPWNNGDTASLQIANINTANPTISLIEIPDTSRFFYYGGPFFTNFNSTPPNYEVWATSIAPDGTIPEANIGENEPTIIKYNFGSGNVILFSYHPEILIGSDIDNVKLSQFVNEDTLNWDLGNQTLDEINFHSWNIVHAALQIANNENVTKITSLPVLLSLKILLEGGYNLNEQMMGSNLGSNLPSTSPFIEDDRIIENLPQDITDWILVELKETSNGNAILSKSLLLRKDGKVVRDDGKNAEIALDIFPGDYYIVVKHRNHIQIMSSDKFNLNSN